MVLTRKRIMPEEEKRMWLWIYKNLKEENKDAFLSCGLQIWNQYIEHYGIKDRTADSYATRFRKIMKPSVVTCQLKPSQINFIIKKSKWNITPVQQKTLDKMLADEKAFDDGDISGYVDDSSLTVTPKVEVDDSDLDSNQNTPTTSKMLEKCAAVVKIEPSSSSNRRSSRACNNRLQNYNEKFLARRSYDSIISPGSCNTSSSQIPVDDIPKEEIVKEEVKKSQKRRAHPVNKPAKKRILSDQNDTPIPVSIAIKQEISTPIAASTVAVHQITKENISLNEDMFLNSPETHASGEDIMDTEDLFSKLTPDISKKEENLPYSDIRKTVSFDVEQLEQELLSETADGITIVTNIISMLKETTPIINQNLIQSEPHSVAGGWLAADDDEDLTKSTPNISVIEDEESLLEAPVPTSVEAEQETEISNDNSITQETVIPFTNEDISINENNSISNASEPQKIAGGWNPIDDEDLTKLTSHIFANRNNSSVTPKADADDGEQENSIEIQNDITVAEVDALPNAKEKTPLNEISSVSESQNIGGGCQNDNENQASKMDSNISANEDKENLPYSETPKTAVVDGEQENITELTDKDTVAEEDIPPIVKENIPLNDSIISNVSQSKIVGWNENDYENQASKTASNIFANEDKKNLQYPKTPKTIFSSPFDTPKESNVPVLNDIEMSESSNINISQSNDTSMKDKASSDGASETDSSENSTSNDNATPIKIHAPTTPERNVSAVLTPKSILYSGQRKAKDDGSAMRVRFQSPEKSAEKNLTPKRTNMNTPEFSDIDTEILQLLWHKVHGDNVNDLTPADLTAFKKISLFKDLHMRINNVQTFFRGRKPTPSNPSSSLLNR